MELPPLSTLFTNLSGRAAEQANVQLDAPGLPRNLSLSATVESVIALAESARQPLLNQLAKLATEHHIAEKLTSPFNDTQRLQLVSLILRDENAQQQQQASANTKLEQLLRVLVVTPLLLRPKAQIAVTTNETGQLTVSKLPLTALAHGPSGLSPPSRFTPTSESALQQGLRDYVAFSEPLKNPQITLNQLERLFTALPASLKNTLIPIRENTVFSVLTGPKLLTPAAITPQYLASRIAQSGHFLEARLSQNELLSNTNSKPIQATVSNELPITDDTKQRLLEAFERASAILNEPKTHTEAITPSELRGKTLSEVLHRAASTLRQSDSILAQLQKLVAQPRKQQNLTPLKDQIHQLIRAAAALGLARISANQLQQLANSRQEPGSPTSTHVEFLLRIQDNVIPISLFIQEKYSVQEEEQKSSKKKSHKKSNRLWRLFMELELPEDGKLASEISYVDEKIHTRLWTESETLQQKTKRRLQRLSDKFAASGLNIDEIVLEKGAPPKQETKIQQQLIDIKT
ncbi:flagellar hook-length control protein FliK [Alteromonadaceae bacterium 2753L.S.0a.02]|nr:flagellar hook-length control protein FliK [Alteromonadaceae bacterium 2753L.S.0a.02]